MKDSETKQYDILLEWMWCAVNHQTPQRLPEDHAGYEQLLKICIEQNITAFVAEAVERSEAPEDIRSMFRDERLNAVRVNILMNEEGRKIQVLLEQEKVPHVLLKGETIGCCYPDPFLRQKGDIDIWIEPDCAQNVKRIMTEQGYNTSHYGIYHDDVYRKAPFYCFEMHRMLFTERELLFHQYYEDRRRLWIPTEGTSYEYHLTDEEVYIYCVLHAVKHLQKAGVGIRVLTDLYYYLERHKGLDFAYIQMQLNRLKAEKEEQLLRQYSTKLFSPDGKEWLRGLPEKKRKWLYSLLQFGAYGNREHEIQQNIDKLSHGGKKKGAKLRYLTGRIFSIPEVYKIRCPRLYRHRLTRPLIFFVRLHNGLTVRRKSLIQEMKIILRK